MRKKKIVMKKILQYDRADTCPACRSERSIEAYMRNGNPVLLSLSIDRGKDISTYDITYLKCKNCKKEFFPKWIDGYPTPMVDSDYDDFMNTYKESLKMSES